MTGLIIAHPSDVVPSVALRTQLGRAMSCGICACNDCVSQVPRLSLHIAFDVLRDDSSERTLKGMGEVYSVLWNGPYLFFNIIVPFYNVVFLSSDLFHNY